MPADEEVGVVDRVVGDVAVVLVGDEEAEYELATASLPEGVGEGAWLRVRRDSSGLVVLGRDESGETKQRRHVEERLRSLRQKRGGRFG